MSKQKTNEEMLKEIYQFIYKECDDKEVPTKFKSYFKKLEQDLYKVNKYDIAINDIVSRKPVMDKYFEPTNGLSISEYVNGLVRYVSQLSNEDNLIISAVYEKYQREHEIDLLIAKCKPGTKVKVANGSKDYICEIEDITFEYFRTNYIKEHECQFKLYFNEYGTYWKLLDDNEEIVNESLEAFEKIIDVCNYYHHTYVSDKDVETIHGYPIDNIRKDLEIVGIIKSLPSMRIALYNACDTEKYFTHKEKREKIKEWLEDE